MNKAQTVLAKIALLVKSLAFESAGEPLTATLPDGRVFSITEAATGGKATVDGSPAPSGDYELSDGRIITVDDSGTITNVAEAQQMEGETPPAGTHSLADGTSVSIDKLEAGGKLLISGVAASAGDYTLSDGTVIAVDAQGVITSVTPVPGSEEMNTELKTPEQMMEAFKQAFADGATPDLAALATMVKALFQNVFGWQLRQAEEDQARNEAINLYKTALSSQENEISTLKDRLGKAVKLNEELVTLITAFAEEMPAGDPPPVEGKKIYSFQKGDTKKDKFSKFQEAAQKL